MLDSDKTRARGRRNLAGSAILRHARQIYRDAATAGDDQAALRGACAAIAKHVATIRAIDAPRGRSGAPDR